MKNLRIIFAISIIFSTSSLSAQYIEKDGLGNKYNYLGTDYRFKQMEEIFSADPQLKKMYDSVIRVEKVADITAKSALGVIAFGLVAALADPSSNRDCDLFCLSVGQAILLVSWFIVVPTLATVSLGYKFSSAFKRRKLVAKFNNNVYIPNELPRCKHARYQG